MEAAAPPQTSAKTATAGPKAVSGPALSDASAWGGTRQRSTTPLRTSAATPGQQSHRQPPPEYQRSLVFQDQQQPQRQGPQQTQRQPSPPKGKRSSAWATPGPEGGLASGLEELRAIIEDLRMELRALRRENELLRRAQVVEPWRMAGLTTPPSLLPPSTAAPVWPPAPDSPVAMEQDKETAGLRARESGETPEAKRTPAVARALVVDPPHDV